MKRILLTFVSIMIALSTLLHAEVPTEESVTRLYVATFKRAPDATGLNYWVNESFDGTAEIEWIASSFFDQPETQEKYPPGYTNAQFVLAVYDNLFNRTPDQEGLEYWVNELESGSVEKSVFILAVINGAQDTEEFGNDATILENKTIVGLAFADAGLDDVTEATIVMEGISDDYDTVAYALEKIDSEEITADMWDIFYSEKVYVISSETVDSDGDGIDDSIYTYNFDEDGILQTKYADYDLDGNADLVSTYEYDYDGNLLSLTLDYGLDGIFEESITYTYDVDGYLVEEVRFYGDRNSTIIITYSYDADGNLLTSKSYTSGIVFLKTYTYDSDGYLVKMTFDQAADGIIDRITTYTYDIEDNLVNVSLDLDIDGIADYIWTYTYDVDGNRLSEIYYGSDGIVEHIYIYTYDSDGNLLTESYDKDGDNIADSITTYTYDTYGNRLTESIDNDANGTADSITTYTWIAL